MAISGPESSPWSLFPPAVDTRSGLCSGALWALSGLWWPCPLSPCRFSWVILYYFFSSVFLVL